MWLPFFFCLLVLGTAEEWTTRVVPPLRPPTIESHVVREANSSSNSCAIHYMLITHARADYAYWIQSLLLMYGVQPSCLHVIELLRRNAPDPHVYISNDAVSSSTSSSSSFEHIHPVAAHHQVEILRMVASGQTQDFKNLLVEAFVHRNYEYVVIVEDDVFPGPDLPAYFHWAMEVMELDSTVVCASAYNDNGWHGHHFNLSNIMRGEHFMGLGWMTRRPFVLERVLPLWSSEGQKRQWAWDRRVQHAMPPESGAGCLFPEVPRSRHVPHRQGKHLGLLDLAFATPAPLAHRNDAAPGFVAYDVVYPLPQQLLVAEYDRQLVAWATTHCDRVLLVEAERDGDDRWVAPMKARNYRVTLGMGDKPRGIHKGTVVLFQKGVRYLLLGRYSPLFPLIAPTCADQLKRA